MSKKARTPRPKNRGVLIGRPLGGPKGHVSSALALVLVLLCSAHANVQCADTHSCCLFARRPKNGDGDSSLRLCHGKPETIIARTVFASLQARLQKLCCVCMPSASLARHQAGLPNRHFVALAATAVNRAPISPPAETDLASVARRPRCDNCVQRRLAKAGRRSLDEHFAKLLRAHMFRLPCSTASSACMDGPALSQRKSQGSVSFWSSRPRTGHPRRDGWGSLTSASARVPGSIPRRLPKARLRRAGSEAVTCLRSHMPVCLVRAFVSLFRTRADVCPSV